MPIRLSVPVEVRPVFRNAQLTARWQKDSFCGHFSRVVVSDFRSLRGDIVSEALSARQSPAAKIPFLAAGWRGLFASATGRPVSLNGLTLGQSLNVKSK
jgi:hypothetical protein